MHVLSHALTSLLLITLYHLDDLLMTNLLLQSLILLFTETVSVKEAADMKGMPSLLLNTTKQMFWAEQFESDTTL